MGTHADYTKQVRSLCEVMLQTQERITQDPPDKLFIDNINLFVKAYLVSLCTCLEAFLQDLAFSHMSETRARIDSAKIPHNVLAWSFQKEPEKNQRWGDFSLPISRKQLCDELSGNPGKTIRLFRRIGIDLQANEDFSNHTDIIATVVTKRNNIIHHNDEAADISVTDVLGYAGHVLNYMTHIVACVAGG